MSDNQGLIFAYCLDGKGGGTPLDATGVQSWQPSDGVLWAHLDYDGKAAREWLNSDSGIDHVLVESLAAMETRPRLLVQENGLLSILRGINLNEDAEPDDMVSIRAWFEPDRIITLRRRKAAVLADMSQAVLDGNGPLGPGDFLEKLCDRLAEDTEACIADLSEVFDAVEDDVLTGQAAELRPRLSEIRRTIINLRRYLAPQRDVIARLYLENVDWLDDVDRQRLREIADRTIRNVEEIDTIRERATVTHEEISSRVSEQMNKTMYILSMVTGIFLPLSLLTGLLGINVAGIPGSGDRWAFTFVCVLLVVLASVQIWWLKRKKWM